MYKHTIYTYAYTYNVIVHILLYLIHVDFVVMEEPGGLQSMGLLTVGHD